MANTRTVDNRGLRKSLKRAQRRRLKAVDLTLTIKQRSKLRRARKEKYIGLRAWLASEKKAAEA